MSKPASEITINELSANMGSVINELFPVLRNCIKGLSKLEDMQKAYSIDSNNYNEYKKILEIHSSVLYVIIEAACAFRADFKSNIAIEKRINLKYVVQITSEFFKAVFIPLRSNKTLWNDVSVHLSSLGFDVAKFNIEESIEKYDNDYFQKDKDNRDISVHYDLDLVKLYEYLVNMSEEKEAKRLCDFMAIVQPLNQLITLYSSLIIKRIQAEDTSVLLDNDVENIIFGKLKEELYPQIGSSLQHFAKLLDGNMHLYRLVEKLPMGNSGLERIKAFRNYTKISILLHYIYMDLGTASLDFPPEVWEEIERLYLDEFDTFVAHNAPFDRSYLKHSAKLYRLHLPEINWQCSLKIARQVYDFGCNTLGYLCEQLGIPEGTHHRAGDDAEMCARLYLRELCDSNNI